MGRRRPQLAKGGDKLEHINLNRETAQFEAPARFLGLALHHTTHNLLLDMAHNAVQQAPPEKVRLREAQWIYIGPLAAAPLAHVAVSSYRHAKTTPQKRLVLGVGVAGVTAMSIAMRLYLMNHAGYAGADISPQVEAARSVTVLREEKDEHMKAALTPGNILRQASKGLA